MSSQRYQVMQEEGDKPQQQQTPNITHPSLTQAYQSPRSELSAQPMGNPTRNGQRSKRPGWAHTSAKICACIQIIAGSILIILDIISFSVLRTQGENMTLALPRMNCILVGVFSILSGSFGIAASIRKTKCLIITWMVLSIILSVGTFFMMSAHIAIAVFEGTSRMCSNTNYVDNEPRPTQRDHYINDGDYKDIYPSTKTPGNLGYESFAEPKPQAPQRIGARMASSSYIHCTSTTFPLVIHGIGIVTALISFIATIIGSGLTCRATCCQTREPRVQIVYVPQPDTSIQMAPEPATQSAYITGIASQSKA